VSWFNDFIGRFSQETKPRPQKLANFIDRLTSALLTTTKTYYLLKLLALVAICYDTFFIFDC